MTAFLTSPPVWFVVGAFLFAVVDRLRRWYEDGREDDVPLAPVLELGAGQQARERRRRGEPLVGRHRLLVPEDLEHHWRGRR